MRTIFSPLARPLSLLVTACLAVSALQAASTPGSARPDCSVWYRFECPDHLGRSTGPTPWPTLTHNVEWLTRSAGRFGGAIHLPGTRGNGLYLPNPVAFFSETSAAGTVALWARTDGTATDRRQVIFDFMASTRNTKVDGHQTVMLTAGDKLVTWPALARRMEIDNPLLTGNWTHLALTWDCTNGAALYVNGKKAAERKGAFKPVRLQARWPGRIGCHTVGGGFQFKGDLDEVRLFNRALSSDELATLATSDPTPRAIVASVRDDMIAITNTSDQAVAVAIDRWLPARTVAPPWYGYTPAQFNTSIWTGGTVPTEAIAVHQPVEPHGVLAKLARLPQTYYGPSRIRVMVGTRFAKQEVPLTPDRKGWSEGKSQSPRFGLLDRKGLHVSIPRTEPAIFPAGIPLDIPLRIENDQGRPFSGTLNVAIVRDGNPLATAEIPLRLRAGAVTKALTVDRGLTRGRHDLVVTLGTGETATLVQRLPVFATADATSKTICAIGAAYTDAPDDADVLRRMAADGVSVTRLGGKRDGASFRHNQTAAMTHGMKVWRTPAFSYRNVCADPAKLDAMKRSAAELGEGLRDNLGVINQSMAGEGLGCPPCYCEYCTRDFQNWLQRRYGTLDGLSQAWQSTYAKWEDVSQLGSPQDVDMAAERLKMMQVALELPKNNTKRWQKLFELDRSRAIDWRRWHDALLVHWYQEFANTFRKANQGTVPIGEQPCWANFKTHVLFALGDIADTGGIDLYLPGEMKTTLGYAAELFLNFDMNVSLFHNRGKPVMLHELYVQDLSPPGLAEAQGWWLIGRGYNVLTYFTYSYYYEGKRAGLPLIFGMFDKEGNAYPCYVSFKQFSADLQRFHTAFDMASLRRVGPRVAVLMSDDMSLANILESGGATWNALGVQGHNGSYWLTERNGYAVEFVNDDGFDDLDRESVLIVPWSHVLRKSTTRRVLRFAKRGGTVLIDGAFAQFDECYQPHPACPGYGAADVLGVSCKGIDRTENAIVLKGGATAKSRGVARDVQLSGAVVVLHRDAQGRPAVVERRLGRGRVVWLLTALGPKHRTRAPEAAVLKLWGKLVAKSGIAPRVRFAARNTQVAKAVDLDHGGKGLKSTVPLPDVSARIRDDRELFVFAVSFFGASAGDVVVDLPAGDVTVTDALSGETLESTRQEGQLHIPLKLSAFGSRVIRIVPNTKRKHFRNW